MLKDVRERKGMTAQELAEKSGVSRVMIHKIELGYKPKRVTLGKLAKALEVEIEEIENK